MVIFALQNVEECDCGTHPVQSHHLTFESAVAEKERLHELFLINSIVTQKIIENNDKVKKELGIYEIHEKYNSWYEKNNKRTKNLSFNYFVDLFSYREQINKADELCKQFIKDNPSYVGMNEIFLEIKEIQLKDY